MDDPTVLMVHTVDAPSWSDVDRLRAEIESRLPDVDLTIARTPPESAAHAGDADVLIATFVPSRILEAATELSWIQALSAGVEFYDFDALGDRGIVLTSAAGVHAEPIAEQVLGYMLSFERGIHTGIRQQSDGVWQRYEGGELRGKTLGVLGLGSIGSRVAEYGSALGMSVIGTKRDPTTAPDAADAVFPPEEIYTVLQRSDYVVVACPLTDETRGMIGYPELGVMDSDAVLVNIARGEIVDEDALVHTLQESRIRGAALDVFETEPLPANSPLWNLSNVIVTPHMAGSTPQKFGRLADIFAENYETYRDGRLDEFRNRVL